MRTILEKIPYSVLIAVAVFMLLAPFRPMPHVLEKMIMLKDGLLTRPMDIFDLFFHLFNPVAENFQPTWSINIKSSTNYG